MQLVIRQENSEVPHLVLASTGLIYLAVDELQGLYIRSIIFFY